MGGGWRGTERWTARVALSVGRIVFLVTPGQSDKTSPARRSDKPLEIPSRIESGREKRQEESVLQLTGSFVWVQDRVEASEHRQTDRQTGSLHPKAAGFALAS